MAARGLSYEDLRKALEDEVERPLTSDAEMQAAYAEVTGLPLAEVAEQWDVITGGSVTDCQVLGVDGELRDDPVDVLLAMSDG